MVKENTTYAPVLIPTLCRFEHFKRCVESLMECSGAEMTDVFIALDYPAREQHWNGYNEICNYLDIIKKTHPFKSLNVIKRNRNYGLGQSGNFSLAVEEILNDYSNLIPSEDDNIFAPAFLEFVNKYLRLTATRSDIFAVCGYQYPLNIKEECVYFLNSFSAWGYGITKTSWLKLREFERNTSKIKEIVKSDIFKNYCIIHNKKQFYLDIVGMSEGKEILGDSLCSALQITYGMKSIFPGKSLVRNIGWDGSGTHGGIKEEYSNQEIDLTMNSLNYKISDDQANAIIEHKKKEWFENDSLLHKILTQISWLLYSLTGKYVRFEVLRSIYKKIRSLKYK